MLRNARSLPAALSASDRAATAASESQATKAPALHELAERLARDSRCLEGRLQALESLAQLLKSEIETSAEQLLLLLTELDGAEQRLNTERRSEEERGHRAPPRHAAPRRNGGDAQQPQEHLAAREREVLKLLTEGMRSPCIAEKLGIKTATVEVHRRNIMRKLNLHSVAALTKYALRTGLTSL